MRRTRAWLEVAHQPRLLIAALSEWHHSYYERLFLDDPRYFANAFRSWGSMFNRMK